MRWIKYFGIFFVIYFELLCSTNGAKGVAKGVQACRFTKMECLTSGKTLLPGYKCFVKAYSRSYATVNIHWKLKSPISDFKINITLEYKYVTTYRQIIKTPDVDFCLLMNGKSVTSAFYDMVFNVIRGSGLKSILHECPFIELNAYNFTIAGENMGSVFPSGDYRITGSIFDAIDPKIVVFRVSLGIVSPIKTSF